MSVSFYSRLVRLEVRVLREILEHFVRFYSRLVRLEVGGGCESQWCNISQVSIPDWFD